MALETATYIDGLNASNPAASDAINTADDHLRLIKSAIKATFPNISAAVTKTAAEINDLASQGDLTDLEDSVNESLAPFLVPSGGIIMWSGSVASIPSGWYLCNGSNGTPDLRDRFVIGAGSSYAVAATGGSKDAIVVSHTHTASSTSTVTDPGHFHDVYGGSSGSYQSGGGYGASSGRNSSDAGDTMSKTTGITVATSTSIDSTGSSGTNANLPPYYALAFIMKA